MKSMGVVVAFYTDAIPYTLTFIYPNEAFILKYYIRESNISNHYEIIFTLPYTEA